MPVVLQGKPGSTPTVLGLTVLAYVPLPVTTPEPEPEPVFPSPGGGGTYRPESYRRKTKVKPVTKRREPATEEEVDPMLAVLFLICALEDD